MLVLTQLRRRSRLLVGGALPLAMLLVPLAGTPPASAGGPGMRYLFIDANPRITGLSKPFRLHLDAMAPEGLSATVGMAITRSATDARASVEWRTTGTFDCSDKLGSCSLGSLNLGTYGHLDLTFRATGDLHSGPLPCADAGATRTRRQTRAGELTGVLRLQTHVPLYGTIRDATAAAHRIPVRFPGTATRITVGDCPSSVPACSAQVELQVVDSFRARRMTASGRGEVTADGTVPSLDPDVTIRVSAHVTGAGSSMLVIDGTPTPLSGATLHLPTNPFLHGEATYSATKATQTATDAYCTRKSREGTATTSLVLTAPGMGSLPMPGGSAWLVRSIP